MRCEIFTDPLYHSDTHLEFDPAQVVAVEEKTIRLFLRGKHRVTEVTLQSGARHILKSVLCVESHHKLNSRR